MSFELENRLARKLAVSALAGEDWWSLVETAWKEPGEKVIVQAAGEGREPIFLKARDGLGKLADRTRLELSGAVRVDVGINFPAEHLSFKVATVWNLNNHQPTILGLMVGKPGEKMRQLTPAEATDFLQDWLK